MPWVFSSHLLPSPVLTSPAPPCRTQLRELFRVPLAQVERLRDAMVQQMEAGLEGKPGGLLMLPSYVDILPSG